MPNTLAHFGVQGVLTRLTIPSADPKIIFLGCLLPDVPWIEKRILESLFPTLDPYTLRLYVIVQATLFMTILLCGALALLSNVPGKIFGIFAMSSILHLLLDALQTKWANGVHLFAPISWELLNFGLFWPESLPTYLLTGFGLGYVIWSWKCTNHICPRFASFSYGRMGLFVGLLFLYMALPLAFLDSPLAEDNHFLKTLQSKSDRIGRTVEVDRKPYLKSSKGDRLRVFGEDLKVQGLRLEHDANVSIRGRFIQSDTIELLDIHEHTKWLRDGGSYLGLMLLVGMWIGAFWRQYRISSSQNRIG